MVRHAQRRPSPGSAPCAGRPSRTYDCRSSMHGPLDQGDVPFVESVEGVHGFVDFVFEGLGVGGGVGLFGGLDAGGEGGEAGGRGWRGGGDGGVLHEDGAEFHVAAVEGVVQAGHGEAEPEVQELRIQDREEAGVGAGEDEAFVVRQVSLPVEQRPHLPADLGIDDLRAGEGFVVGDVCLKLEPFVASWRSPSCVIAPRLRLQVGAPA